MGRARGSPSPRPEKGGSGIRGGCGGRSEPGNEGGGPGWRARATGDGAGGGGGAPRAEMGQREGGGPAGRGQGAGRRDLGKIRACSRGARAGGREGGAGDLETKEETKGPGVWEGHRQAGLGEGRRGTPRREGCECVCGGMAWEGLRVGPSHHPQSPHRGEDSARGWRAGSGELGAWPGESQGGWRGARGAGTPRSGPQCCSGCGTSRNLGKEQRQGWEGAWGWEPE